MLSPSDAKVAERDRDIPALSLLLDPEAFREVLQTAFPVQNVTAVRSRYARYKPATNCLVAYSVDCCGREIDVYAKAYRPGSSKVWKSAGGMTAASALGQPGVVLYDLGVAIFVYPNDNKLKLLPGLQTPDERADLLSRLLPERPGLWRAESRRLRYKPERRYVERLVGSDGSDALLRLYNAQDYARACKTAGAFRSGRQLHVARRLAEDDRQGALVMEWLPGQPLDEACRSSDFDVSRLRQVGSALAELHSQDAASLAPVAIEGQEAGLLTPAKAVAMVCPHLSARAHALAGALAPLLARSSRVGPIHGDFSADQVLLEEDGVAIIDFDAARLGDPVADLGSFAAHLQREVVRGHLPAALAEEMSRELRTGYGPHEGFEVHGATALLHLAYSPFRYREPDWERKAEALLELAEEMISHA